MNENELIQLWNEIGNDKIGAQNRFLKSIKMICSKPVIVVTDEENIILSNMKQTITKYQIFCKHMKHLLQVCKCNTYL